MGSGSVTRRRFLRTTGGAAALGWMNSLRALPLPQSFALPRPGPADWPRFGYDIHNTRFNAKETTIGPSNVERLKIKWQFDTDENFVIQQTPAVIGATVFFGSGRYHYALDSATG